jgi:hypothetical protein
LPAAARDDEDPEDGGVTVGPNGFEDFRKRHGFDEWRDTRPADAALFVWRFFLGGQELPGHRALRTDSVEAPGLPPAFQSLWRPDKDDVTDRPTFRIDTYEAPSRVEARELLLRMLAQFQSPLIERRSEGPGDVAFGMSGNRSLVFARANMVVVVLNAGDEVEPVEPVAREFDRLFTAPSEVGRSPVRPEIRRAEVAEGKPAARAPVPLVLEAEDPLGRRVWFRLSAKGGEFSAHENRVFYAPEAEGRHAIEIAAVNENLGVAVQQLEFEV